MRIQTNYKLELRRLIFEKRRFAIQKQQLGIIHILFHFYIAISNFYALCQSSLNTAPSKPYMVCYISLQQNFEDEVSGNKVKNEVFGDVEMELIDYERD